MNPIKQGLQAALRMTGREINVIRPQTALIFDALLSLRHDQKDTDEHRFLDFVSDHLRMGSAQLFQDLFALYELNSMKGGYFVEFGATDGKNINNTWTLEKHFAWTGVLAEPAKGWLKQLQQNRTCVIDTRCVWSRTGEQLQFNEVAAAGELSTIEQYTSHDSWAKDRQKGERYTVNTVTLNDLLEQHKAPPTIHYMSVDTEGSEYEILKEFDFSSWDVQVWTIEHAYTERRQAIYELLTSKGYRRKFEQFSRWDDWYVKA
jgi:FkbM family methyltransferase